MEASVIFLDEESGDRLGNVRMAQPPDKGHEVELGPVVGDKLRYSVVSVVWQVFSDAPFSTTAVVTLRRVNPPNP
jgi:hypothetical protein